MKEYTIYENLLDLKRNEKIFLNNNDREETGRVIRYVMKEGINNFQHANIGSVIAIDYGLNNELVFEDLYSSRPCGKEVVVFYSNNKIYINENNSNNLGKMLSKVDLMDGTLPEINNMSYPNSTPIIIENENFINNGGLFDYFNMSQSYYGFTFKGSTFKTAPRIFKHIDWYNMFPWEDASGINFSKNDCWRPFQNCKNIEKIEYQGDFSDDIEVIGACDFTYKDSEGIEHIDAYPQGGKPRILSNYVNMETYTIGLSGEFPKIDTSLLTFCFNPVNIKQIDSTASSTGEIPEVIGIDINDSPRLKILKLYIPKIIISDDLPFMYGAKILGYDFNFPSLNEIIGDTLTIKKSEEYRIIEQTQETAGNNRIIGYPIFTPQFVSSFVNSNWGASLKNKYGSNEPLLVPTLKTNTLKTVNNYYSVEYIRNYNNSKKPLLTSQGYIRGTAHGPFFVPTDDNLTSFTIPPLPSSIEVVNGYCENLFEGSFFCTNYPIDFNNTIVEATFHATIPPLPENIKVTKNYLYRTFAETFGEGKMIHVENNGIRDLSCVYGSKPIKIGDYDNRNRILMGYLNMTENNSEISKLYDEAEIKDINTLNPWTTAKTTLEDKELPFKDLILKVYGDTEEREEEVRTYTIDKKEYITLKQNPPLSLMSYAINWMQETWYDSTVDPTIISTLQPLNNFVKSENAYKGVLYLTSITPSGSVHRLTLNIGTDKDFQQVSMLGSDASVVELTDENKKELSYDIKNVIVPDNFFIQNKDGETYESLMDSFSFLFYGDFKEWVIKHGGGTSDMEDVIRYLTGRRFLRRRSGEFGWRGGNKLGHMIFMNGRNIHGSGSDYSYYYIYPYIANTEQDDINTGIEYMPETDNILSEWCLFELPLQDNYKDIYIDISNAVLVSSQKNTWKPRLLDPIEFDISDN